jgi:hypothetical protein
MKEVHEPGYDIVVDRGQLRLTLFHPDGQGFSWRGDIKDISDFIIHMHGMLSELGVMKFHGTKDACHKWMNQNGMQRNPHGIWTSPDRRIGGTLCDQGNWSAWIAPNPGSLSS